ncbi:MAG: YncE family protein [Gammaproteobacteria bacterium]|nr:YncE family protein [Gammaproteobacteria bacterium]MBV8405502.1 YncE family protein [Gammaproteobacteria bacterium]
MKPGMFRTAGCARLTAIAALGALSAAAQAAPQYHLAQEVKLPGDGGWDDLTFDDGAHRLFISHGTQVLVVDTDKLTVAGTIEDTPGVHGIALATDVGHGYISAGRSGNVVVFDLKTLARLKDIKATGENPDAILYDSATHRVFSFNGRGRNATVIDSRSDEVVGTIALDAKPEFAVSDGKGTVYVNLEDKSSIAQIDAQHMKVTAVWPVSGCEEPSGLAIDIANQRLFAGCGNKVMAVVDARSGHTLGTAPIGQGVDGAKYDSGMQLAFASCGEGVLTAVSSDAGGKPHLAQSIATQRGARTMTLDEHTHRIFLVTASFGPPPPATPDTPHPRPAMLPGSFRLLVVEPVKGSSP